MTYEHGEYLLIVDHNPGCMTISAVPDTGETIRRRFMFYTEEEALEFMRALIDNKID